MEMSKKTASVSRYIKRNTFYDNYSDILSVFQHDEGSNCGDLGSSGGKGRYLMFPHATDEVRENNDKFSHCSVRHISKILKLKKDDCFVGEGENI